MITPVLPNVYLLHPGSRIYGGCVLTITGGGTDSDDLDRIVGIAPRAPTGSVIVLELDHDHAQLPLADVLDRVRRQRIRP